MKSGPLNRQSSALPLGDLAGFPLMMFLVLKKEARHLPKEEEFARGSAPSQGERAEPNNRRDVSSTRICLPL
jgi:hypothetical protein